MLEKHIGKQYSNNISSSSQMAGFLPKKAQQIALFRAWSQKIRTEGLPGIISSHCGPNTKGIFIHYVFSILELYF